MQVEELLSHLSGVRRNGSGWTARCPAHDDQHNSLSISNDEDKILLYCHAGCETTKVIAALGLTVADLFTKPKSNGHEAGLANNLREPRQWLAEYCGVPPDFLERLPLTFDGGRVRFTFDSIGVTKRRTAGTKDMVWEPDGAPRPPLWPTPETAITETVWVTEGESDCVIARYCGLDAYAMTKGAGTPLTLQQAKVLKDRGCKRVCLVLDADKSGVEGALKQAKVLTKVGLEVRMADLYEAQLIDPLLGQKDLRDAWLMIRDANTMRQRLEDYVNNLTSHYREVPCEVYFSEADATELATADIPPEPDSLPLLGQRGYIIRKWSHIVSGYPKAGKTELIFACVLQWLFLGIRVLWISEESRSVWQQRLSRHTDIPPGLRIVFAIGTKPEDLFERAKNGDEEVIVVDTVRNLLQLIDENNNSEIASALGIWEAGLQGKTRIYLHHERKSGGEHGQAIAGGAAFLGVVDRAIELRFDPHSKRRRQLVVHSRISEAPDLLYELTEEGLLKAIGEPGQVAFEEVRERVVDVLCDEWITAKEALDLIGDPKPSLRQVQEALTAAFDHDLVERDPREPKKGATYRWCMKS